MGCEMRATHVKWFALAILLASACALDDDIKKTPCSPPPSSSGTLPNSPAVFGGEANRADVPPPPLSGGTLAIVTKSSDAYIVASVPEGDAIEVIRVTQNAGWTSTSSRVSLERGAEPGRIVVDGAGRAHIVLRRAGAIVTIDPETATILARRDVCPAPRGIAWDEPSDSLHVVCATGELVTLAAAGGPPTRRIWVDRDLRDVVVLGDRLLVTRFRAAELLTLDASGAVVRRMSLPAPADRTPHVAWRMTRTPYGVAIAYQLHLRAAIDVRPEATAPTPYGSSPGPTRGTGPLVVADVVFTRDGAAFQAEALGPVATPAFDLAFGHNGLVALNAGTVGSSVSIRLGGPVPNGAFPLSVSGRQAPAMAIGKPTTSSAFEIVAVQTREPATVQVFAPVPLMPAFDGGPPPPPGGPVAYDRVLTAPIAGVSDTGFDIFHTPTSAGIACASCHPEGGDDGHVWRFITKNTPPTPPTCVTNNAPAPALLRRTQSLRGGISQTAPLHWDGDMPGMNEIASEVFTRRMGGGSVTWYQREILARWIDSIPSLPPRVDLDPARVASGRAIFGGSGQCASCHAGATLTNNATLDVGRGPLQVPGLIGVGNRAPFLHDGCAKTLLDRFDPACGGDHHGAALSDAEKSDIVTYLESL